MTKPEWRELIALTVLESRRRVLSGTETADAILELLDQHGYGKPLPTKEWAEPRDDVQSNG